MATVQSSIPALLSPSASKRPIPPLENGDQLTRAEYLERYANMPPKVKAERIEGIVYVLAAVSAAFHGDHHANAITWLGVYKAATPGLVVSDTSTIALDLDNDSQPDACSRVMPSYGGNTKVDAKGYIEGSPELIVEITASSLSYDLGAKLNAYRRNGVREYIVHRTYDGELDWFLLRDGQYARLAPDSEGIYRSEVFPGLWLKADALIAGKLAEVLAVLQTSLAAAEHLDFIQKLEAAAAKLS